MNTRWKYVALLSLGAIASTLDTASATEPCPNGQPTGPIRRFFSQVKQDCVQNNIWPKQFVGYDRIVVEVPFDRMIANGWRMQNTLDHHHFVEGGNTLTEAGELKVREILTQNAQFRTVFVYSAYNPEDTLARIENVRNFSLTVLHQGEMAEVMETTIKPRGTPAEAIDDVRTRYRNTVPDPRLPAATESVQ